MAEAFSASVASNLVSKLGECLFAPIGRQFGYVLCYKSYVKDLTNRVEELETAWERMKCSVDEATYDGKLISSDVVYWLENVKEETEKANDLLKYCEIEKNACVNGWLPNPVRRYLMGKKVVKKMQVIQGLHQMSINNVFRKVYYENPPTEFVTATTSALSSVDERDVLESRALITEAIMKAITDDKVCVIGVHGPGGVGKSTLLEYVERRVKEEHLFDVVATANVSRDGDLKRIQGEIAYALGLKIMNEETARGRADLLCKRLEKDSQKNILIILDNLWKKLELKEVGIPCRYDNKVRGCKLLLSSRYRDVLQIGMDCDKEFQLNELEHEEARRLFEMTVGDRVNDPELKPLVDEVVKNCGGLPLSIVSEAIRLKHSDLADWRKAWTTIE